MSPNDQMSVIRDKVSFYRTFASKDYAVYDPVNNRVFETEEINSLLFRDSGLKDGSDLQLKEPEKSSKAERKHHHHIDAADAVEEGDEEGDDDNEEMLDSDEEALLAAARAHAAAAEGGECEMSEPEDDQEEGSG